MIEIVDRGVNQRTGRTVLKTNRKGWDELVTLPLGQTEQEWLAAAREQEARAAGQAAIAAQDAEIDREVMQHEGILAVQDVTTGKVTGVYVEPAALGTFIPPTMRTRAQPDLDRPRGDYRAPSEGNVPPQLSSAEELKGLRADAAQLQTVVDDPAASQDAKATAQSELDRLRARIQALEAALAGPQPTGMTARIEYERDARGYIVGAHKA